MEKVNYMNSGIWVEKKKARNNGPLKAKIKSITVTILENLWDSINELGETAFDRRAAFRIAYGNTYLGKYNYSRYSQHIDSLHRRGYIKYSQREGQNSIVLTNKAKLKILDRIFEGLPHDSKYRFISFDIPEKMRKNRDQFRRSIKQLGFRQIQKSLWVTNRNVGEYVEIAAYELGVEQYVAYIIAEKTDIDGLIDKMFRLGQQSLAA